MRKTFFSFLLLFLVHIGSFGQDGLLPLSSKNKVVYSDLAAIAKPKDSLFQNAQRWVVRTFGNYENAVVREDRQAGKLVLKSYTPVAAGLFEYLRFTLTIDCQDNKYVATIDEPEGISKSQTVTALGSRQNEQVQEQSIMVKAERNRKKRQIAENTLNELKNGNDQINQAMYSLLASLKLYMAGDGQ